MSQWVNPRWDGLNFKHPVQPAQYYTRLIEILCMHTETFVSGDYKIISLSPYVRTLREVFV